MKINVKQIAKDSDITRVELAQKIGVSLRTLDDWQCGKYQILAKNFIKLLIFTKENLEDFKQKYVN